MSAPRDVAKRHLGRTEPPRDPMPGRRDTGCRATPNGWSTVDAKTRHAAEIEALAEAGTAKLISDLPIGDCFCGTRLDRCTKVHCRTMVCPMAVDKLARRWGERNEWKRHWSSFRTAALMVDQWELSDFLNDLAGNPERLTKKGAMRKAS